MIGGFESLHDFRIHLNGHILVFDVLLGPGLDLALHPLLKSFTNNRVDDVSNVGPRKLIDLSGLNRQGFNYLR